MALNGLPGVNGHTRTPLVATLFAGTTVFACWRCFSRRNLGSGATSLLSSWAFPRDQLPRCFVEMAPDHKVRTRISNYPQFIPIGGIIVSLLLACR